MSSNLGKIITMLVAILAGFPTPLKASHILWINLITDFLPALALGMDKNDGEARMKEPPRKAVTSFAQGMTCTLCLVWKGIISLLAF